MAVINGTSAANTLNGTSSSDYMNGFGGDDRIFGLGGKDNMYGGDGNDLMEGGIEGDTVRGEAGNDRLFGGVGNDWLSGGIGDDYVEGTDGNDQLFGDDGADHLSGGFGNDRYTGGKGNDLLYEPHQENWSEPDLIQTDFDTFTYNKTAGGTGGDIIEGFVIGKDKIILYGYSPADLTVGQSWDEVGGQIATHFHNDLRLSDGTTLDVVVTQAPDWNYNLTVGVDILFA